MRLPWQSKKKIEVLPPLEGYNRWAATYQAETNPIKKISDERIEVLLPNVEGRTVLDAGCGTGHFCELVEKRKAGKVVGVDISPAMINLASKGSPSTEFRCQDISVHALEKEYYDVIICALVIGHIADLKPAMNNILSSLKSGGTILLSDFHPFLTLHEEQRTFRDSTGKTMAIAHHLHLFQDTVRCFRDHDVTLEILEEPLWNEVPVVYILKGVKK